MDIAGVLSRVVNVETEDDGALTVRYEGTFASLRTVTIADGLELISLTQVLAWDLPLNDGLTKDVAAQADSTTLGTVALVQRSPTQADVVLRYNFPFAGLADSALQTLVLMVLSGGADVRRAIAG